EAWVKENKQIDQIESINAENFLARYNKGEKTLDVRKPSEFESGHLKYSLSQPLDLINQWIGELDKNKPYLVHCQGGYRSMIAISLMKAAGYHNLSNVEGGYSSISKVAGE